MKYYVTLIIALILSNSAYAYQPLIREGVVWEYSNGPDLTFEGTKVISDTVYHRLINIDTKECEALMREENKKVYLRKSDEIKEWFGSDDFKLSYPEASKEEEAEANASSEILIYDFSAQKGDSYLSWSTTENFIPVGWTTEIIDTETIRLNDGNDYTCQKIIGPQYNEYIEGVGAYFGWLYIPQNGPLTNGMYYDRIILYRVYDRDTGEILYGNPKGYKSLIREDRVWEYFVEGPVSVMNARHNLELYKARFDGFETIDGQKYSRFVKFLSSTWTTEPNYDAERELIITPITENQEVDELIGLFREEGGKVYIYVDGDEIESYNPETGHFETISLNNRHEQLLYDFTKDVGEEYTAYCNDLYFSQMEFGRNISPCTVLKSSDDQGFERLTIGNTVIHSRPIDETENPYWPYFYSDYGYIVEGIGNVGFGGFVIMFQMYSPAGCIEYDHYLNRVYDNSDNVIYQGLNVNYPTVGITSVEADGRYDDRMYDMMGREIRNPLPGTVYIQRGRKYIAR